MKKIALLLTFLCLLPASLSAAEIVRLTRYENVRITGVDAEHMFRVELVKSDQTRAVVEIDAELERYLRFELAGDGTVEVSMEIPDAERRRLERQVRDYWKSRTLRLTVYLPEIQNISLSDMSRLKTGDAFAGDRVTIRVEDMSRLETLRLTATDVDLRCSDMSKASLDCTVTTLNAAANDMSKIDLNGSACEAKVNSNDMSVISGNGLTTERGEIEAHDMAKASLHVTRSLYLRSSSMGSASYTGNPPSVDIRTPRKTEYRQVE
jgi:hypothetical protein